MRATESQIRTIVQQELVCEQWSDDVDVERGKMHDLLGVPQDEDVEDEYDSGQALADDLVDAVGDEQEASGMIAFAANIDDEENIYDDALDAIKNTDYDE